MADAVISDRLDKKVGNVNVQRPWRGYRAAFDAVGANSGVIDKRGYGLVGFKWDTAFTIAITCSVHVCEVDDGTFVAHPDFTDLDLTTAGAANTDVLAEWPYMKLVLNAAETSGAKNIEIVLT
jgi:hypothetical protein